MSDNFTGLIRVTGVAELPYDILLAIFTLLPSRDLVRFLCCCRDLYERVHQDSIWRNLCAPYGLHNISRFGGRSWYTIYTRLLHPYGPMLGLWAGDHPYTGSVLDVSLHPGDDVLQGGIVINMWQFRLLQAEDLDGPEGPEPPISLPLVRIDFSTTTASHGRPRVVCCCSRRSRVPAHLATLELFSSNTQSLFLQSRQGRHPHPDFPSEESLWIDESRYPHLLSHESMVVDQSFQLPTERPRIPIVFTAPTTYHKPPAISISCHLGCVARNRPFLGFDNHTPFLPRYYPLRHVIQPRVDAASSEWRPMSLVGPWLGSHGPHGTECLYLQWREPSSTLSAWKITGDENVPRGALSWEAYMGSSVSISRPSAWASRLGDLSEYKLFEGSGTISARGFFSHQRNSISVVLAVPMGDPDTLRVAWVNMEEVSSYMRYKIGVTINHSPEPGMAL